MQVAAPRGAVKHLFTHKIGYNMSTHSHIAVRNSDKTVTWIYCHCDGYPSYNGYLLQNHYNTEEKARALVALGWLSSLGAKMQGEYNGKGIDNTVGYVMQPAEAAKTENSLLLEEWNYLFENGQWLCRSHSYKDKEWRPLGEVLATTPNAGNFPH